MRIFTIILLLICFIILIIAAGIYYLLAIGSKLKDYDALVSELEEAEN